MKKFIFYLFIFQLFSICNSQLYSQSFNDLVKRYREAQKLEQYEDMIQILDTMLLKYPEHEPEITYFNRGNTFKQLNETKKAIDDYTKAIEIRPNYSIAYNNRATCYYDLEEYDKAVNDYTKVLEYKDNPLTYYNRANAYSFLFNYKKAISDYSKSIELKPDFAEAYYNRGNKYNGMGLFKEAISDWENAIKYEPGYENELRDKINEAKYQLEKKK